VAWLVRTVFTDDDKKNLKVIAAELIELRKLIEELTESLVNVSDKKLMKMLNASQDDLKENKVLNYKEKLEKQIDIVEKEFRS
jgi:glutathionyl-hydroquinone reductase